MRHLGARGSRRDGARRRRGGIRIHETGNRERERDRECSRMGESGATHLLHRRPRSGNLAVRYRRLSQYISRLLVLEGQYNSGCIGLKSEPSTSAIGYSLATYLQHSHCFQYRTICIPNSIAHNPVPVQMSSTLFKPPSRCSIGARCSLLSNCMQNI